MAVTDNTFKLNFLFKFLNDDECISNKADKYVAIAVLKKPRRQVKIEPKLDRGKAAMYSRSGETTFYRSGEWFYLGKSA